MIPQSLLKEVLRYWITYTSKRNPKDLIDYYLVLAYIETRDPFLYEELVRMEDSSRDLLMEQLDQSLKDWEKFLKNFNEQK